MAYLKSLISGRIQKSYQIGRPPLKVVESVNFLIKLIELVNEK